MSEVKRFTVFVDKAGYGVIEKDEGELVFFKDYAALKADRDALAAENVAMLRLLTEVSENYVESQSESEDAIAVIDLDYISEVNTFISRDVNGDNPFTATDAYASQLRAEGGAKALEDFADFNVKSIDPDSDEYTEVLMEVSRAARGFAANLRKENGNE